jgi:hypothetical protein
MPTKTPFHVYSEDSFEDAFTTEAKASAAAKRASKTYRERYYVVLVGVAGFTGGGKGRVLDSFYRGKKEKA